MCIEFGIFYLYAFEHSWCGKTASATITSWDLGEQSIEAANGFKIQNWITLVIFKTMH
jgi:hypothetical protein